VRARKETTSATAHHTMKPTTADATTATASAPSDVERKCAMAQLVVTFHENGIISCNDT
jgi:hypothetical protein